MAKVLVEIEPLFDRNGNGACQTEQGYACEMSNNGNLCGYRLRPYPTPQQPGPLCPIHGEYRNDALRDALIEYQKWYDEFEGNDATEVTAEQVVDRYLSERK